MITNKSLFMPFSACSDLATKKSRKITNIVDKTLAYMFIDPGR
ncbi:MAG: hypothetical protein ACP5RT_02530 [Candidatus Micrarchaeia archaeon]